MPVLTIASHKGGSGKTTLATALAAALAAEGVDVALLDADPNRQAHRWATSTYKGPKLAAYAEVDTERVAVLLPELIDRHAVVIADTAGFGNLAANVCMTGADAVLVPVSPGEGDVFEGQRTVTFVEGLARTARRPIPVRIVANRIRRNTALYRHVLAQLAALNLPRLQVAFSDTVGFGELSFAAGLPAPGTAAAAEIGGLLEELRGLGWLPVHTSDRKEDMTA
jgi:chromosome partitioning protein